MLKKYLFIIIIVLLIGECKAQSPLYNRDGFYSITSQFKPKEWKLFEFQINPFSPVFITEVAVADSTYIIVDVLDDKRAVVNSSLSNPSLLYEPAINELNWNNITDNNKLPVINGKYLIRVKAYCDSAKKNILFSDSTNVLVLNDWMNLELELVYNSIKTYPGYYIPNNDSLHLEKERKKKGINWSLLGARYKKIDFQNEESHLLSLSFKFTSDEYGIAFSSFYKASNLISRDLPFKIDKKISFNSTQNVEIKLRYKEMDLFLIQQFDSDLAVLNLEKLWEIILVK